MSVPYEVIELVERFKLDIDRYRSTTYKEEWIRQDFIDPLFEALGWDVANTRGVPVGPQREVIPEDAIKVRGATKAPDYGFYLGGMRKFFVEAKKPSVNLEGDTSPAFQLRRYAWSAKLPLSILTDFEEFALYDCRFEPKKLDGPKKARLSYLTYEEYPDRWEEIASVFSKEAVLSGSLEKYAEETKRKKGTETVDASFLKEIEGWRSALARDIAAHNDLNRRQLNHAVQMTIDRLIFLRMAEDRGIEDYGRLLGVVEGDGVYSRLFALFQEADDRYDSGLFHFRSERERKENPDVLTPAIKVGDRLLRSIIRDLYYPESPYEFSVLPVDVLGQVYEQFLGKVIHLEGGHKAVVEEKPEVRKAGGVYYTPTYIVDYIVEHTVGTLLEGKRPGPRGGVSRLRIVDPACGSGSFLLGAYQYLLDWHRDRYVEDDPDNWPRQLYQGPGGEWRLTIDEKKRILTNNIYGVDIDPQAVEVTKLSLLLKVLEGETDETLESQLRLFAERALPDLDDNIKCGNSLIGPDFYDNPKMLDLDDEEQYQINVFNWKSAFPQIFSGDAPGFDAVIGNPPWLMAGYYAKDSLGYFKDHFETAEKKFDMYYLFIEQACRRLLSRKGLFGMIVPNKFFHTEAASALRKLLSAMKWVRTIVDFGAEKIFPTATNYSCLLFLESGAIANPRCLKARANLEVKKEFEIPWSVLGAGPWYLYDQRTRTLFRRLEGIWSDLEGLATRFGTGVQSGADSVLIVDAAEAEAQGFESGILQPIFKGKDVRRYHTSDETKLLIFPYEVRNEEFVILTEQLLRQRNVVYKFLLNNKKRLSRRVWFGKGAKELSGKWYGMMYLDSHKSFATPHILTPSLSDRSNFALGTGDLFATGTAGVTSIIPKSEVREDIKYILGILNSSLISFYAISHSPVFSGGYYKFSAPYLKYIPVRTIDFSKPEDVKQHYGLVELVGSMLSLHKKLAEAKIESERTVIQHQIDATDRRIDRLVYELYGLTDEEIEIVEKETQPS